MTGEEYSGPPGPKLMRLVYFVGAGGNPISLSLSLSLLFVSNFIAVTNGFSGRHRCNQQMARVRK